jgi:phosphomannomutase/phosphoglucomutase
MFKAGMNGVRIDFPDSWALIRASNTSPKLRLTIEAKGKEKLLELKKKMLSLITEVANAALAYPWLLQLALYS